MRARDAILRSCPGALLLVGALATATPLAAQRGPSAPAAGATRVGPTKGAVVVVGGGAMGPEILARFIALAGGPDALIIDVPTAGGDSVYPADWRGIRALKAAGARNVVVLHTVDPKVADSEAFAAPVMRAGGVWFEGGRQWHLVDSYAGTRTERAFHDVLARGGVVGGSSAGASILSSYMLRGARAGNTTVMAPGYEVGFGFLRGVAIDQHVVARDRLRDLADSLMPRHPELLGISEDEGTAWVVRGDTADIIGRNKAFVYGGRDATDPRRPFLTLYPGDRYDLGARRVLHRAIDDSPLTRAFADSVVRTTVGAGGQITLLVAQDGKVLLDEAYGIADSPTYLPPTTAPNFALGGLSRPFTALAARLAARAGQLRLDEPLAAGNGPTVAQALAGDDAPERTRALAALLADRSHQAYRQLVTQRIFTPIGAHRTTVDSTGALASNVDELYRLALGLQSDRAFARDTSGAGAPLADWAKDDALGWQADRYHGVARLSAYGAPNGRQHAFVRLPERRATIIVLTDRADADARTVADRLTDRLLARR